MKSKKFIKDLALIQKSISLCKGDTVELYKNTYKIIKSDNKLTLMADMKGTPVAYNTDKLRAMLATREIKKAVVRDDNPDILADENGASDRTKSSVGISTTPAVPDKSHLGMIRVDKVDSKGRKYHYWVHATHGTKHEDPESGKEHELPLHEHDITLKNQMTDVIDQHIGSGDKRAEADKLLNEFIADKSKFVHLREAHNQLSRHQGGLSHGAVDNLAEKQRAYKEKFNKLKDMLADAKLTSKRKTFKEKFNVAKEEVKNKKP